MDINAAFPGKYVAAADLQGNDVTVEIGDVKIEEMEQGKETKPVVYFVGMTRGMVLNKTNANTIVKVLGSSETENWRGKSIIIHPTSTDFQGETKACIRVRPWLPGQQQAAQPQPPPAAQPVQPAQQPTQQPVQGVKF